MNIFKIILSTFFLVIIYSCAEYKSTKKIDKPQRQYFSSKGFALIYEKSLYIDKIVNKKIKNDEIELMHDSLIKNTPIKITNPENSKFVVTKVFKKSKYPNIFNVVISKEIASILELDPDNPYVEINEIKKNRTFVAKESNTFDEEKNVAEKAPIDEVKMDVLSKDTPEIESKTKKNKKYTLIISDFYYLDSANNLKDELIKKTKFNNIKVKKISKNKYRLFAGPFKNFNALKTTYISLNNLGFEGLNIYKE